MKRKTFWLSALLIFAACVSVLFMLSRQETPDPQRKKGGINMFTNNATYTEFNKLGQIQTRIQTANLKHYEKNNASTFIKPTMLIYTNKRIPWNITADHGRSENGKAKIYLWGHVVLHQPQRENHPETTILTSTLTIYPKRNFAKTNKKVIIHRPDSVVQGKGVTADLKTGIIKLLTHSRSIYEPSKKP